MTGDGVTGACIESDLAGWGVREGLALNRGAELVQDEWDGNDVTDFSARPSAPCRREYSKSHVPPATPSGPGKAGQPVPLEQSWRVEGMVYARWELLGVLVFEGLVNQPLTGTRKRAGIGSGAREAGEVTAETGEGGGLRGG